MNAQPETAATVALPDAVPGPAPYRRTGTGGRALQKILIIDDDEGVCYSLARLLASDDRRVTAVQTVEAGFEALRGEDPDVVLLDVRIGKEDGLEILRRIRVERALQLVVIMTAHGTTETAIEAMKRGAFDYLLKPFDSKTLKATVEKALSTARLNRKVITDAPEDEAPSKRGRGELGDHIIGKSPAMQRVYKLIGQVAPREVPVLVRGESGTGKELVARALWQHSARADKQFLAVNCAALTETLLESELFGHEKGAFTGAESRKLGKFEQADGGTLYLDEVGDMSLATQAKILRVLQDGTFYRVGGHEAIGVDVRIVAATHQDLERLIKENRFREDLYYRLRVVEIVLPPLRERREDIPELVRYMIARHRETLMSEAAEVSAKAMDRLTASAWPGNVRQLENVIRRGLVLCNGPSIAAEDLDFGPESAPREGEKPRENAAEDLESLIDRLLAAGKENLIEELERLLIARALEKMNGNQVRTAKLLGITRNTLRSRMEKFGLKPKVNVV
ncbi:MAG: sigma-54 dependent transcriptional regulator [Planctomycetota bacterium]|nr:sigma-54 dependent transcriptional regulator [Planctomycetota bacterium]